MGVRPSQWPSASDLRLVRGPRRGSGRPTLDIGLSGGWLVVSELQVEDFLACIREIASRGHTGAQALAQHGLRRIAPDDAERRAESPGHIPRLVALGAAREDAVENHAPA